ncbi:MAG TPA: DNA polymerase IV, partial [Candidatus Methylomirabilis sp.]|nr:DNA polymerase IV [Candidatus Methylomirabilis sp.]
PEVEEYSIDECFADLTGMRRTLRMSYPAIAEKIKDDLARELGFTFSLGLAPNKVVAKIGSKWNKPNGLTVIPARDIPNFTGKLPVEKIWGIGPATTAFLNKFNIRTALDFSNQDELWVKKYLSKPFQEIWRELRGESVYEVSTTAKESYASIQKVKTFTPPSADRGFVFSQLGKNIENACIKARRYNLAAPKLYIFLRTQNFYDNGLEIKLTHATAFPHEIIKAVEAPFNKLFKKNTLYRSTGVTLINLTDSKIKQPDLFGVAAKIEKTSRIYNAIDKLRAKYGKHTTYIGASFFAHNFAQHAGARGQAAERKQNLFKGETARRRLAIPMFLGEIN